jgi:hypothetical protein
MIKKTLRETLGIMNNSLIQLNDRGVSLVRMEEDAETLRDTSEDFFYETQPWYKTWWLCSCKKQKKKKKKELNSLLFHLYQIVPSMLNRIKV